jgi:D-glycero-D-manno-heptose 1,7-bisphosphate phosphatase
MAGALFLDRDGVLNAKPPEGDYVKGPDELVVLPGVPEALGALRRDLPGLRIAVVTNQRGIALGRMGAADVDAIHDRLREALAAAGGAVDAVLVCPHDRESCACRKPGIGLFLQALEGWPDLRAEDSALVGDSAFDIIAGHRLGARTWLVGEASRRRGEAAVARAAGGPPDGEADSLPVLVATGALTAWLRSRGAGTVPPPTPAGGRS